MTTGMVWIAREFLGGDCGYLVTEADNLNRPIAYIDHSWGHSTDGALKLACAIAEDGAWDGAADAAFAWARPDALRPEHGYYFDLRGCGRMESPLSVPRFLYGMTFRNQLADTHACAVGQRPQFASFYCRFLQHAMGVECKAQQAAEPHANRRRVVQAQQATAKKAVSHAK